MNKLETQRNATIYDKHQLPQSGVEKAIIRVLGESGTYSPNKLIINLKEHGFTDSAIREGVWSLIDRGYVELTRDWKLKGHNQPTSPAPIDLL